MKNVVVVALPIFLALLAGLQLFILNQSKSSSVRKFSGSLTLIALALLLVSLVGSWFEELFLIFSVIAFMPLLAANLYYRAHCNDCGVPAIKGSRSLYTYCDQCAPKHLRGK
jgi:hypothetical protein